MALTDAGPEFLGYAAARARVLEAVVPLTPVAVDVTATVGRPLREPIAAPYDLPPFANASMDGVAVRSADLAGAGAPGGMELPIAGERAAGATDPAPLPAGAAFWIMTGAPLPAGADAVIPIEDLDAPQGWGSARVGVSAVPPAGMNVRDAGADVRAGDLVFAPGRDLSPHDLAVLVAFGLREVQVGPRPRAFVLSTGDELLGPGDADRPGAIRDSNGPMLAALLAEAGAVVAGRVRISDDPAAVATAVREALAHCDVVCTIGGVSAGAHDPVRAALASIGGVSAWRVAMKPGRPQAFGTPEGRLFFGLPGNPASVACVFEALVRPALRRLQGFDQLDRPRLTAAAARSITSRAGRTDFVRVRLRHGTSGWVADPAGDPISGHLLPQARAHGLLMVPEAVEGLAAGDAAEVWVLRWPEGE